MMKRILKSLTASVLAAAFLCMLTGCGAKFDASGYVKAALDAGIHGENVEEYAKIINATVEEASADHQAILDKMTAQVSVFGLSDELEAKYRDFFSELLKKTDYTVLEATENEDGSFTVPVETRPIVNIGKGLEDEVEAKMTEFAEQLLNGDEALSNEEELTEYAGNLVYQIVTDRLENVEYGEKQTIALRVELNEDRSYSLNAEDIAALDSALIDMGDLG